MNRHAITTNSRALPGVGAFVRAGAGLGWMQAIDGMRSPGEGDLASP
ncbi:MAG TPA: hypothetical protein VFZ28_05270 [Burkholderiaceae bacterium]|nr:hypothetical protein [Burkholderiaceae bacterium]